MNPCRTIAAALTCAVAVAACGASNPSSQSNATGAPSPAQEAAHYKQSLRFAQCMRSHGVANFPDPGSGGGISVGAGSGINPQAPAFQAAQTACQRLLPGGGPGGGHATEQFKKNLLTLAECMRAHGVSGFPDPTSSPPSNIAGYGVAFGRPGAFLAIPRTIDMSSPTFQQAGRSCHMPGFARVPGS